MKPIKSFVGMATPNFSYYSGRFTKTKVLLILDLGFHVIITFHGSFGWPRGGMEDFPCDKLNFIKLQQWSLGIMKRNPLSEETSKYLRSKLGDRASRGYL